MVVDDIFLKKVEKVAQSVDKLIQIKAGIEAERATLKQNVTILMSKHQAEANLSKKKKLISKRLGMTEALKDLNAKRAYIDGLLSAAKEERKRKNIQEAKEKTEQAALRKEARKQKNIKADEARKKHAAFVKAARLILSPEQFSEIEEEVNRQLSRII